MFESQVMVPVKVDDGVHALYFRFFGEGSLEMDAWAIWSVSTNPSVRY